MTTQQDTSHNRRSYGTSVRKSKTMQEDSKQSHPTQQAQDSKQPLESNTAQPNPTNPIESSLDSSFMNDSNHIESTATKTTQSAPMDSNHIESKHPATHHTTAALMAQVCGTLKLCKKILSNHTHHNKHKILSNL